MTQQHAAPPSGAKYPKKTRGAGAAPRETGKSKTELFPGSDSIWQQMTQEQKKRPETALKQLEIDFQ